MKNADKIFNQLASLSSNFTQATCVSLISEVKASGMDETEQNEFISVAKKTMTAETKRISEVNALIEKYGTPDNIDPAEPDDEDYY